MSSGLYPSLELAPDLSLSVPGRGECEALWEKYAMLANIRDHSRAVADVAMSLARRAEDMGVAPGGTTERTAQAAAMLHDLAKTWTILHGGAHDQLGAAIVRAETGNPLLAQAVLFHVHWPWEEGPLAPEREPLRLALLVAYADKRVRHDRLVSLEERFDDLMDRYGDSEEHRASIRLNRERSLRHEAMLLERLRLKNEFFV